MKKVVALFRHAARYLTKKDMSLLDAGVLWYLVMAINRGEWLHAFLFLMGMAVVAVMLEGVASDGN
jgi:hypothetical protein